MAKTTLARRLRRLHLQAGYEPEKRYEMAETTIATYRAQRKAQRKAAK